MISPGVAARLREIADVHPGDLASRGTVLIGDHDAREILAAVDTLQAVRLYLDAPAPSLDTLRTLLRTSGIETVQLTQTVRR
jgi:hypothetical protein